MPFPRIVVRSWRETLPLAHAIQLDLGHDFDVEIWQTGVLGGETRLEELKSFDAAIVLLSPEESTLPHRANDPRDNYLLELGIFLGRFGTDRTFLVVPRKKEQSTLSAERTVVATLAYDVKETFSEWQASIGPVCTVIRRALADLVTSNSERVLLGALRQTLTQHLGESVGSRRVFLSYSSQDRDAADRIATELESEGLTPWVDRWELSNRDSILRRVDETARSSDIVVFLLSPNSLSSAWAKRELTEDFRQRCDDRAVTFLPAMVAPCVVPKALASRHYFDLRDDSRKSLRSFVRNVSAAPNIDFLSLEWRDFERLAAELLRAIGYSISRTGVKEPFDFIARRKQTNERWLVETKFYTRERASVAALRELVSRLLLSPKDTSAMLITNSRLTSAARGFLADESQRSGRELRVIDGSELTDLLIQNPGVVDRYFRSEGR